MTSNSNGMPATSFITPQRRQSPIPDVISQKNLHNADQMEVDAPTPTVIPADGNTGPSSAKNDTEALPASIPQQKNFTPVLPDVPMGPIPLKDIAGNMIQASYTKLQDLVKTLPTVSDMERKRHILDYALSESEKFKKLLVLSRWAQQAKEWQKLMNIHPFIDHQMNTLRGAADQLYFMVDGLKRFAETSLPDVGTAVDVLGTGKYQRLPTILDQVIPKPPMTKHEISDTIQQLTRLIKTRLELEIIPEAMRKNMVIANGCVTFRVENLFQVALTLVGRDFSLPWRIVELEILVQSADDGYSGLCTNFLDYQKHDILNKSQVLLEYIQKRRPKTEEPPPVERKSNIKKAPVLAPTLSRTLSKTGEINAAAAKIAGESSAAPVKTLVKEKAKKSKDKLKKVKISDGKGKGKAGNKDKGKAKAVKKDSKSEAPPPPLASIPQQPSDASLASASTVEEVPTTKKPATKPHNPYPILHLFEYLHKLTLRLQLRILRAQAEFLARERWRGALKIEFQEAKEVLRLSYWDRQIPGPDPRTVPAGYKIPHKRNVMEFSIKVEEPVKDIIFQKWMQTRKRKFSEHVNPDHVAARMFGDRARPRRFFDVRCYSVIPDLKGKLQYPDLVNPETGIKLEAKFDSARLDLEKLLNDVAELQARFTLRRLRNILLGRPKNEGLGSIELSRPAPVAHTTAEEADPTGSAEDQSSPSEKIVESSSSKKRSHDMASNDDRTSRPPPVRKDQDLLFGEKEVRLREWFPTGNASDAIQTELLLEYRQGHKIKIIVDVRTGQIIVLKNGRRGHPTSDSKLMAVEQRLNDYMDEAAGIFIYVRYMSFIDEIESWAQRMALRAQTESPLKPNEEPKIAQNIPLHRVWLRLPGVNEGWLLIALGPYEKWLTTYGNKPPGIEAASTLRLTGGQDNVLFRIWLVITKHTGKGLTRLGRKKKQMHREIESITPVSVDDVFGIQYSGYKGTKPINMIRPETDKAELVSTKKRNVKGKGVAVEPASSVSNNESGSSVADTSALQELLLSWDYLDMETLMKIENVCRAQYGLTKVASALQKRGIPYHYILGPRLRRVRLEELPSPELRLAGRYARICIPAVSIAGPVEYQSLPFGDVYIAAVPGVAEGTILGDNALPGLKLPIGNPARVRTVRLSGMCGMRGQTDMDVGPAAASDYAYDQNTRTLMFHCNAVDDVERWVSLMFGRLRSITTLGLFVNQAVRHGAALEALSVRLNTFNLSSVRFSLEDSICLDLKCGDTNENGPAETLKSRGEGSCRVSFSLRESNDNNRGTMEMLERIKPFIETHLSGGRNLPQTLVILKRMMALLKPLWKMEQKRNAEFVTEEEQAPMISIHILAFNRVRMICAQKYGIEFVLHTSGKFIIYDVTRLPSEKLRPPLPDGLEEIPHFYSKEGIVNAIKDAVHGASIPLGTITLPVPFGVCMDAAMLETVIEKIDAHMTNIGLLMWFNEEADKKSFLVPSGTNSQLNLSAMRVLIKSVKAQRTDEATLEKGDKRRLKRDIIILISVSATSNWKLTLLPHGLRKGVPEDDAIKEEWSGFAQWFMNKLNALPPGVNLRPFLALLLDFFLTNDYVFSDFLRIPAVEGTGRPVSMEVCLAVPENAPAHLGAAGSPAIVVESKLNRIGVVCRFHDSETNETIVVPIRYNYATLIVEIWRAGEDDGVTSLQERNGLMEELLNRDYNEINYRGVLSKVNCHTLGKDKGGPGKLAPFLIASQLNTNSAHAVERFGKRLKFFP